MIQADEILSFIPHPFSFSQWIRTEETVNKVVTMVEQNPRTSIRRIASCEGMPSIGTVHTILKEAKFYPYVLQVHHRLREQDKQKRVVHAQSQLALMENNPEFLGNLLFSDESHFPLDGTCNKHNSRKWSRFNPGWCKDEPLHSARVTVWAAIGCHGVIGPVFIEENVNGANYLQMLQQTLMPTIQQWPSFDSLVFMQDGAPPHWSVAVRNFLTKNFNGRWMGRGSPNLPWPPYSPDLTPCDFFLWGWVKSRVYETPCANMGELRDRIQQTFVTMPHGMINRAIQSYKDRLFRCIAAGGASVEEVRLQQEE
jgi:transposase